MGDKRYKDYENVVKDYLGGMLPKELAEKYQLNNPTYVYRILRSSGVETKRNKWNPELVKLLKQYYPLTEWEELLKIFPKFTKDCLFQKASELNIKRLLNSEWSMEENKILKDFYGKVPYTDLQQLFPYRSLEAISTKANRLNIIGYYQRWSDEEIEKLVKEYPYYSNSDLSRMFNGRTSSSIMSEAMKLGLSKTPHLFAIYNKEELIKDLQEFAKELCRTPIGIEVSANKNMAHHMSYVRYFGSYTNACKEAGLVPCYDGSVYVTHVYYSKNNDLCLSQAELQITNLFIDNDVDYLKEVMYRDLVKDDYRGFKRCDWVLGDLVVEYFGMPERVSYQKRIVEKRELCEKNGLQLLELYPEDIGRGKNLDGLIEKFRVVGISLIT